MRRADGELVRVQRRVSPVTPEGGETVVLVAMQDLSEWQQTRQRLETLLAELQRTNPAELLYPESFEFLRHVEGRRGLRRLV